MQTPDTFLPGQGCSGRPWEVMNRQQSREGQLESLTVRSRCWGLSCCKCCTSFLDSGAALGRFTYYPAFV